MTPNRIGTVVEYKKGHYYLSMTDWGDGHCEIEIHRCIPEQLYHSCDMKDINDAKQKFFQLSEGEIRGRILSPSGIPISESSSNPLLEALKHNEETIIIKK